MALVRNKWNRSAAVAVLLVALIFPAPQAWAELISGIDGTGVLLGMGLSLLLGAFYRTRRQAAGGTGRRPLVDAAGAHPAVLVRGTRHWRASRAAMGGTA